MPESEPVARRQGAVPARIDDASITGPRLITHCGKRINSPDNDMDTDSESDGHVAVDQAGFDISKVVVDRDELRRLRGSEAAVAVAEKALGDEVLMEIRTKRSGPDYVHRVNPYDLYFEDDHNPRDFTPENMRERVVELARSIAARGVRKPLDVYLKENRLYVNGGETRWRATLHALCFLNVKVERIPVIISQGENALDRMIGQWIDNDQLQFNPIEAGKLFRDAVDLGAEPAEIARRIGKDTAYVLGRIKLLEMPQWLIDRVRKDDIKADTAFSDIWIASGEDDRKAKKMLANAVAKANEAGAERVMPKHIRKAVGSVGRIMTASSLRDELSRILRRHQRETLEQAIGDGDTERLYQLAKLAETPKRRGRKR
jgi:ParB/RepB/Spo0J family partition protein